MATTSFSPSKVRTMLDDSRLDHNDGPSIADSIEWIVDAVFSLLGKLLMPWRWFQRPSAQTERSINTRSRRFAARIQWQLALVRDSLSSKFYQSLEVLERGPGLMIRGIAFAASPWRWGKRDISPQQEEI